MCVPSLRRCLQAASSLPCSRAAPPRPARCDGRCLRRSGLRPLQAEVSEFIHFCDFALTPRRRVPQAATNLKSTSFARGTTRVRRSSSKGAVRSQDRRGKSGTSPKSASERQRPQGEARPLDSEGPRAWRLVDSSRSRSRPSPPAGGGSRRRKRPAPLQLNERKRPMRSRQV